MTLTELLPAYAFCWAVSLLTLPDILDMVPGWSHRKNPITITLAVVFAPVIVYPVVALMLCGLILYWIWLGVEDFYRALVSKPKG